MKRIVIWDWNGTLYNDVAVCHSIMNTMLCERRIKRLNTAEDYRGVFGFPIPDYYKRAGLPIDEVGYKPLADRWISLYNERQRFCTLNEEAEAILDAFKNKGIKQIILSATKHDVLEREVISFGIERYFDELLGTGDRYAGSKTDIGVRWLRQSGIDAQTAVFIGDTLHDSDTARAMGCDCILVETGHQPKAVLEASGYAVAQSIGALAQARFGII